MISDFSWYKLCSCVGFVPVFDTYVFVGRIADGF